MPTISIFFGIAIKIYYQEHNPPHIHAYYQGYEGVFEIKTGKLLMGGFPVKAKNLVSDWVIENINSLEDLWNLAQEGKPLYRIAGADQ